MGFVDNGQSSVRSHENTINPEGGKTSSAHERKEKEEEEKRKERSGRDSRRFLFERMGIRRAT